MPKLLLEFWQQGSSAALLPLLSFPPWTMSDFCWTAQIRCTVWYPISSYFTNQDWQKLLNSASTHGSISIHNSAVLLKLCQNSMANLAYYWVKGAAYFNDNKLVFHRWWLDISAKAGFSVKACRGQLPNSWYITLNPSWNKFGCAVQVCTLNFIIWQITWQNKLHVIIICIRAG